MPATQRGPGVPAPSSGRWGLRYYADGKRQRAKPFPSKSKAALAYYRDVVEPQLRGERRRCPT